MNFASLQFAVFVVLLLIGCLLVKRLEHQNALLLVASYYFYACWDPRFLLLIWLVTGASYWTGLRIGRSGDATVRRRLLAAYATFSLAVGIETWLGPRLSRWLTNGGEGATRPVAAAQPAE